MTTRRWFQFHLLTAIVMMVASAILIGLNTRIRKVPLDTMGDVNSSDLKTIEFLLPGVSDIYSKMRLNVYGWPFVMKVLGESYDGPETILTRRESGETFSVNVRVGRVSDAKSKMQITWKKVIDKSRADSGFDMSGSVNCESRGAQPLMESMLLLNLLVCSLAVLVVGAFCEFALRYRRVGEPRA